METGVWQFAADPIRFDTEGNLLDGQHRLQALANCESGTKIRFLVVYGLEAESQLVMDQGRKRSAGQQLSMLGVPNSSNVASGVRIHLIRITGMLFRDTKESQVVASAGAIEKWVRENPDVVEGLHPLVYLMRTTDAPPSVAYAAGIAFWELSPDRCKEFFHLLSAGAGRGHPINALDKRLQRIRRAQTPVTKREALGMFFQTWNSWVENRTIDRIQRPRGGSYTSDNFPVLKRFHPQSDS